jgi:hypothetical protein
MGDVKMIPQGQNELYEGAFMGGKRHGNGFLISRNGFSYRGQFEDGLPHGTGIARYPEGSRYEGRFVEGRRSGFGTLYDRHNQVFRSGFWLNDELK